MNGFSELCIASDESGENLGKLIGFFNKHSEECLNFVQASLQVLLPKLVRRIEKSEENLKMEKDSLSRREREWREKSGEAREKENHWAFQAKQWRETEKRINESCAEKEAQLNDERMKRKRLEAEIENLVKQMETQKKRGDVLEESLAEYEGMSGELNGIHQELDAKEAKIKNLKSQIDRYEQLVTSGRVKCNKNVSHTSDQDSDFKRPPPVLEKKDNQVLAESSPSKSCPPLKRPKIIIPETLGFGEESDSLKRPAIDHRNRNPKLEGPPEPFQRQPTESNSVKSKEKLSRRSSLLLPSGRRKSDEEVVYDITSKQQRPTKQPMPESNPIPTGKDTSESRNIQAPTLRRAPEIPPPQSSLSDEDENQVSSSPLLEKKKVRSKLASRKRRKLEEKSTSNSTSPSSSLSEPWLNASSGPKRSINEGTSQTATAVKKPAPCAAVASSSLSSWDPKDGKRQATVTQMFDPGIVSERARKEMQVREREEEDLRRAMQESLKMASSAENEASTSTESFLDATMIDPELADADVLPNGVSETQALNLINYDPKEPANGDHSPVESSSRRFSKARGFASKTQLVKSQPRQTNPKIPEREAEDSRSRRTSESTDTTPEVISVVAAKVAITSTVSLISDSPFLKAVAGSSDVFVTPAKNNIKRKKRKATPNPQLDEIFGESDAESDVSIITPPKTMTSTITTTTTTTTATTTKGSDSTEQRRVELSSNQPTSSSNRKDSLNSSMNDSAFLTYSQVKRGKVEERKKAVADQGAISHRSKDFRDELKRTDCEKCGKDYLALGFSAEEANVKIWEKCPHGRGSDAENRCETPPHLWRLGPMEKKAAEDEERNRYANRAAAAAAATKRPRRKKPLDFGSTSPKEDD